MQDAEFEEVLFSAAEKVKNIPASFVMLTAMDLHETMLIKGFSISEETDKAEEQESNLDADLEAELANQEDEEGTSLFKTAAMMIGNVAKNVILPAVSNTYKETAMQLVKRSLFIMRAGHFLFFRVVVGTTLSFISNCLLAFRALLSAAFAVIKWAIRLPAVRAALLAVGTAGAAFVAGKYITASDEEQAAYKAKARAILDDMLGSSDEEYRSAFANNPNKEASNRAYLTELQNLSPEAKEAYFAANPHLLELSKITAADYQPISYASSAEPTYTYKVTASEPRSFSTISDDALNAILSSSSAPKLSTPRQFTAESEILETMVKEGWNKLDKSSPMNYSRYGINFNKHRSKAFIDNLTAKQAFDIYKKEYWDAAGVENVPEELRRIYFNTAVNIGPGKAKKLLKQSDGTLEGFSNAKWEYYNKIAKSNPIQRQYLKGWRNRTIAEYNETLDILEARVNDMLKQKAGNDNRASANPDVPKQLGFVKNNKQIIAYEL